MTQLQADFRDFLSLLNAHRVEYLLIGGYAVGYHGYPRATVDLDVWIARRPDNAQRTVAAFSSPGFSRWYFLNVASVRNSPAFGHCSLS